MHTWNSSQVRKPVLYLAGDSTMQTYEENQLPQSGWGEWLLTCLENGEELRDYHRENCPFGQERRYEGRYLVVDNCAMAGRSSRSFVEEGRLADIEQQINKGDCLIIQFGHNDAAVEKPERYVPTEEFETWLNLYVEAARRKGATPILVSSITLRPCARTTTGELKQIAEILPHYANVMEEMAKKQNLLFIDMGLLTHICCRNHEEMVGNFYKEDDVHLVGSGAETFAGIFAEQMIENVEKWLE